MSPQPPPAAALAPLRRLGPADLDAVLALAAACLPAGQLQPRRTWAGVLAGAGSQAWGLDDHGILRAAVLARRHPRHRRVQVCLLAVEAGWRRRGLARHLLARLDAPHGLRLEVAADNRAARAAYLALGFAVAGTIPELYADGTDGIRYVVGPLAARADPTA